jgi:hypothetical protein
MGFSTPTAESAGTLCERPSGDRATIEKVVEIDREWRRG